MCQGFCSATGNLTCWHSLPRLAVRGGLAAQDPVALALAHARLRFAPRFQKFSMLREAQVATKMNSNFFCVTTCSCSHGRPCRAVVHPECVCSNASVPRGEIPLISLAPSYRFLLARYARFLLFLQRCPRSSDQFRTFSRCSGSQSLLQVRNPCHEFLGLQIHSCITNHESPRRQASARHRPCSTLSACSLLDSARRRG